MSTIKRERIWSEKYAHDSVADTEVRDIARTIGASPIFAMLLHNRGYRSAEEAMRFLRFETSDFHDPFLLNDIDLAVERIRLAVESKEKICIYGDYDVDGVTSVSMLYLYLTGMGADVTIKIPRRDHEGYGMSSAAVDTLAAMGVSLIVTVDTGITANEEIRHARELGVDVVVTDHHECHTELPEACAVVNPHRPDSTYPFAELAGVGVVFKLICAYEMTLCRERGESVLAGVSRICKKYADLAAIGTVADVMPLTDENRLIVSMGLSQLENSPRMGVAALMDAANITQKDGKPVKKRKITSGTIGFGLAPRINAAGRISDSLIAVNLILSENEADAKAYAEELCVINKRRQVEENQIAEQAYEMIEQTHDFSRDMVIVLEHDDWQQGIIGIVSSRITEKYGLPSILISFSGSVIGEPHGADSGKGSGRSIKGMNLVDALNHCSDTLEKFGGHELAAGLTVRRDNVEAFRRKINAYAAEMLSEESFAITMSYDAELRMQDVTLALAEELTRLEPFGVGNPSPAFVVKEVTVQRIMQLSGGKHTKLILEADGVSICGVYFGVSVSELGFDAGDKIDVLFNVDVNDYKNVKSVQMIIQDARLSESCRQIIAEGKEKYEKINAGEGYRTEDNIIPTRDDFAVVYTALRHEFRTGVSVMDMRTILKLVNSSDASRINYVKLKYILRIMNELQICNVVEIDEDIFRFEFFFNTAKTNIEKSSILKKLKGQCTNRVH